MNDIQTLQESQDICEQEQNTEYISYRKEYVFDLVLGNF